MFDLPLKGMYEVQNQLVRVIMNYYYDSKVLQFNYSRIPDETFALHMCRKSSLIRDYLLLNDQLLSRYYL